MKKKAIIISIKGTSLSKVEKKIISKEKPWGIMLFTRNIKTLDQTKKLINHIKKISKDKKFPILIDEEGGNISRLLNFLDNKVYSQFFFGQLYEKNTFSSNSCQHITSNELSFLC